MKYRSYPVVALNTCCNYAENNLEQALSAVIESLDIPVNLRGATVLIKPNLISSRAQPLACTHPAFIVMTVRWLLDNGARVKIGDSPAFGTTSTVMERMGMAEALQELPVEQVSFVTPVRKTLTNGFVVEVAAESLDNDLCVNLPKLKAHNQMYMTGAVKNIFGIVVGIRKAMLHMRKGKSHAEFADILLRLPELLPPSVNLIDGIEAMHISGPMDGKGIMLGCLGGSICPVALDTAVLEMLELPHSNSPLWRAAFTQKHPGSIVRNILYPLHIPKIFHGSGFIAPETLNPIRFNPFRMLRSTLKRVQLVLRS